MGGLANCVSLHPGYGDLMPVVSLPLVEGQIQEDREMERQGIIQRIIELGRLRVFVTFDQLNELLPSATTEPEDIEAIMEALSDEGIDLVDEDPSQPRSSAAKPATCPTAMFTNRRSWGEFRPHIADSSLSPQ